MIAGVPVGQTGGISFSATRTLVALFVPLLLVIPGVVGLQVSLWTIRRSNPFSQLEKLVMSALISLGSLFLLYFTASVILWKPVSYGEIGDLSLGTAAIGYLLHFCVAAVVGVSVGSFAYNYLLENIPRKIYQSWDYIFENQQQSAEIEIRTSSGLWIRGNVVQHNPSESGRDLLLSSVEALNGHFSSSEDIEPSSTPQGAVLNSPQDQINGTNEAVETAPEEDEDDNPWDSYDEQYDTEFEEDLDIDVRGTQQVAQYLHLSGEQIEAVRIPGETKLSERYDEEIWDRDRIQRRAASLGQEFGYPVAEEFVAKLFKSVNKGWVRYLSTFVLAMCLVAILSTPSTISTVLSASYVGPMVGFIACLCGTSLGELIRYQLHFESPTEHLTRFTFGIPGVALIVAATGLVTGLHSPTDQLFVIVLAGLVASIPIVSTLHRIRSQYTTTAALTIGTSVFGFLIVAIPFGFNVSVDSTLGRAGVVLSSLALLLLFVERIRVGKAGAYNYWPTVIADVLAVLFATAAAILIIRTAGGLIGSVTLSSFGLVITIGGAVLTMTLAVVYGSVVPRDKTN